MMSTKFIFIGLFCLFSVNSLAVSGIDVEQNPESNDSYLTSVYGYAGWLICEVAGGVAGAKIASAMLVVINLERNTVL